MLCWNPVLQQPQKQLCYRGLNTRASRTFFNGMQRLSSESITLSTSRKTRDLSWSLPCDLRKMSTFKVGCMARYCVKAN